MAFVKLDCGILDSSLWTESAETRIVFVTLLAMSDETGFVHATKSAVARRSNLADSAVFSAFETLTKPDKNDRSGVEDGRRVEEVQGGFFITNYERYRNACNAEVRREKTRGRVARHREKKKAENLGNSAGIECNAPVTECNSPSTLLSSHLISSREGMQGEGVTPSRTPQEELASGGLGILSFDLKVMLGCPQAPQTIAEHVASAMMRGGVGKAEVKVAAEKRAKEFAGQPIWAFLESEWPTVRAASVKKKETPEELLRRMTYD